MKILSYFGDLLTSRNQSPIEREVRQKLKDAPDQVAAANRLLVQYANDNNLDGVLEVLKIQGVNVDAPDTDGSTPLYGAITHSNVEMAKALLEHNADANKEVLGGKFTPLLAVVVKKTPYNPEADGAITKLLLQYNADPNFRDQHKATALHHAARRLMVTVASAICDDPRTNYSISDKFNQRAIDTASAMPITNDGEEIRLTIRGVMGRKKLGNLGSGFQYHPSLNGHAADAVLDYL